MMVMVGQRDSGESKEVSDRVVSNETLSNERVGNERRQFRRYGIAEVRI